MKMRKVEPIACLGRNWRQAFTRTELVLVVATVAFLLLTLAAGGRQLWRESKRAACAENLRMVSQGFLMFAARDGRYPEAARLRQPKALDWIHWQLDRELKESAIAQYCPDWRWERLRCPMDGRWAERSYLASYAMNGFTERAVVRDMGPHGKILLVEQERPNDGCWGPALGEEPLTRRHDGQAHVVFGDGHLQSIKTDHPPVR